MKLAEALVHRKELQSKISRLEERLNQNALVQEGTEPAEDPVKLMKELDICCEELAGYISRISKINNETIVDGKSLEELITARDLLFKKAAILRGFLNIASAKVDRYSRKEILIKSSVDVVEYQKKVDEISKEARLLDALIQYTNWNTEY